MMTRAKRERILDYCSKETRQDCHAVLVPLTVTVTMACFRSTRVKRMYFFGLLDKKKIKEEEEDKKKCAAYSILKLIRVPLTLFCQSAYLDSSGASITLKCYCTSPSLTYFTVTGPYHNCLLLPGRYQNNCLFLTVTGSYQN